MKAFIALCLSLGSTIIFSWDDHFRITKGAGHSLVKELFNEPLPFVPLETALKKPLSVVRAQTVKDFLLELKLNKKWDFPNRLGEIPGKLLAVTEVLEKYSDEPDWGPDRELFNEDQYPELWTEDTPYIAGKEGTKSGGLRHMYFPGKLRWLEPVSSFQIPMRPLGEAPVRADLFYRLSTELFKAGEFYWAVRFLAWSLHFVEDLYQPFHVRQAPNKRYLRLKMNGFWPSFDVDASGDQIAYYHYSYEEWVADIHKNPGNPLDFILGGSKENVSIYFPLRDFILTEVVSFSEGFASRIASAGLVLFPPFNPTHGEKPDDFAGSPQWKKGIQSDGPRNSKLLDLTGKIFERMGITIRQIIGQAFKNRKRTASTQFTRRNERPPQR